MLYLILSILINLLLSHFVAKSALDRKIGYNTAFLLGIFFSFFVSAIITITSVPLTLIDSSLSKDVNNSKSNRPLLSEWLSANPGKTISDYSKHFPL
jgi:hypothetical protein